ncbi:hypothetical protein [Treponema saccharophilum]|uniref:hypothetical protein n=1 Tax=Treponema saccharophilum TaxID=165 RepID=UPI00386FD196
MGLRLEDADGVLDGCTLDWNAVLDNDRILLHELDKAIVALSRDADGVTEYTIDTGQSRQTVKRTDLAALMERRSALIKEIAAIERELFGTGGFRRAGPGW